MSDPHFQAAIELVDDVCNMPTADATRYLFDRYRTASAEYRDEIVLALAAALSTARLRLATFNVPAAEVRP